MDTVSMMVSMGIGMMNDMEEKKEDMKDKCRVQWRESMKLPRKAKKQKRKEILLDWSIADWDLWSI